MMRQQQQQQQQQQVVTIMRILIRIPSLLLLLVVCQAAVAASSSSSSSSRKTRGGRSDTTTTTSTTITDYKEVFQQHVSPKAVWPCRSKSQGQGNIVSLSSIEMDIDCTGSVVVAAYTGIVHSISSDSILLKHTFDFDDSDSVGGGVVVQYQHSTTKTWYTLYKGLQEVNTNLSNMIVGDIVTGGTSLGSSSTTVSFQVMVGAYCSLKYAKSHPLDSCNRKNYEPFVNPLMLYPSSSDNNEAQIIISIDTIVPVNSEIQQHGIISITMSPRPIILNRLVVQQVVMGDSHSVLEVTTTSSDNDDEEQQQQHDVIIGSYQQVSNTEWTLAVVVPYTSIINNNNNNNNEQQQQLIKLSVYDSYDELIGEELVG